MDRGHPPGLLRRPGSFAASRHPAQPTVLFHPGRHGNFCANCVEQVRDMPTIPGGSGFKPSVTLLGGDVADVVSFGAARQDCIESPHQQVRQQEGTGCQDRQDRICVQDCRGGWRIGDDSAGSSQTFRIFAGSGRSPHLTSMICWGFITPMISSALPLKAGPAHRLPKPCQTRDCLFELPGSVNAVINRFP